MENLRSLQVSTEEWLRGSPCSLVLIVSGMWGYNDPVKTAGTFFCSYRGLLHKSTVTK